MLLAVDVGNTHITLGIYKGKDQICHWRISTNRKKTADEYGILLRQLFAIENHSLDAINAVALSSVVPPLTASMVKMSLDCFGTKPLVIGPGVKTGMPIRFDNPKEVGADRIVNGVAAFHKYGGPVIVVDLGTATTFDVISAKGEYLGGAIAPGVGISTDALFSYAAKLPRVELVKPPHVIGKTTVACMQSGIMYGLLGQVEGIVARMKKELQSQVTVVATGGFAFLFEGEQGVVDHVDPFLTLEGLRLIHEMNKEL
ncbi:MAG: type III pantothenate kinase [Clostridia bacterium]|nr:type III pantothenate kinase [Clostridia bacterium]